MAIARPVLWTWTEICHALGQSSGIGTAILGVSIDSRVLEADDLFIALSGKARPEFNVLDDSSRDGHDFISAAIERGAVAVLVDRNVAVDLPVFRCRDTLDGLWQLARFRREQLACPIIAITGSSGKTTLKSFISQALHGSASSGSLNNHIGVPLSLVRTHKDASSATFEIGTNHPGEIGPLACLTRPDVAVVLNVSNAHIGTFGSESALRTEKLSIGKGVVKGGHLVVHENLLRHAKTRFPLLKVSAFGKSNAARCRFRMDEPDEVEISTPNERKQIRIPGGGEHRAATLCATAAVLDVLQQSLANLDLISAELPAGRGNTHRIAGITLIDESYNANPDSMRKCLQFLASETTGRRIAIVGEMAELGVQSAALHASIVPELDALDGVICVGQALNKHAYSKLRSRVRWGSFSDADGVVEFCVERLKPGDVVLVKGSNSVFWQRRFFPTLLQTLSKDKVGS